MKVVEKTMRMEACSLCSLVVETGLMLSPLALIRSLNERLAPCEPAFLIKEWCAANGENEIQQ